MAVRDCTQTRARLVYVKKRNVTLSLPEPVLQRFKVYAASKNQSMSSLMVHAMNKMMESEPE